MLHLAALCLPLSPTHRSPLCLARREYRITEWKFPEIEVKIASMSARAVASFQPLSGERVSEAKSPLYG
jgi:hypothetical protein